MVWEALTDEVAAWATGIAKATGTEMEVDAAVLDYKPLAVYAVGQLMSTSDRSQDAAVILPRSPQCPHEGVTGEARLHHS